ncbi:MAG: TonB-dependent receptor [Verrucomicrobia bacterium]|nr:MAG: TonB-dependent receptor [Verrucomicrobiota bacterium]
MKKQMLFAVALLPAAVVLAQPATNAPAEEIVVRASRAGKAAAEMPENVSIITAQDIQKSGAANVVDVMKNIGGVEFRSFSGNSAQAEVALRGFGENSFGRVLVLLNGQRLNRPDMASINWLQIPLANVERIEVLRGGQSALYGDNANAGVINIVTRQGTTQPVTSISADVASYGTVNARASTQGNAGGLGYAANVERDETAGYRDHSAYRAWGAGGSLDWEQKDRVSATLGAAYNVIDFELPGYLTKAQMDANPRQSLTTNDDARTAALALNLNLKTATTANGHLELAGTYGRQEAQDNLASWMSWDDVTINSFGLLPKWVSEFDLGGHHNTFLLGVDMGFDRLTVKRFGDAARSIETLNGAVEKRVIGVYLRDEIEVVDKLTVGVGARSEQARISADISPAMGGNFDDGKTHHANVADVSLLYQLDPRSKLFARAGMVYRYPFVDEQISYYGFGTDAFNANLDPEYGANYEVGTELALATNLTASITGFLLNMRDEIAYNAVTLKNENLDATRHAGIETALAYQPCHACKLNASYTFTQARFTGGANDGNDIPLVPHHHVTAGGEVQLPWDLAAAAQVNWVARQYIGGDYTNIGPELAAYATLDFLLRYTPVCLPGLQVFGGVDNVTDENYASVAYRGFLTDGYYPSPGRTWKAGASYKF